MEKVIINSTNKIKITPANQVGLNPARLTLELAISIRLDSQTLRMIKVKETGSSIIRAVGVI